MHLFSKLILEDMKPALGVTEPGAIAFACAKARSYTTGEIQQVIITLNSGMYKNAFTCGIPNSSYIGNSYAAALGLVAGNWEKGLEALDDVTEADNIEAKKLVDEKKIQVVLGKITSKIDIHVLLKTTQDECILHIRDKHTNIVEIILNGHVIYSDNSMNTSDKSQLKESGNQEQDIPEIHKYTFKEIVEYCKTVPIEELLFIRDAYKVNLELFQAGLDSEKTTFIKSLLNANDGKIISSSELSTAQLLCNGTIEARVLGLSKPAMSITGSGAHGIICTMPLYAVCKVNGYSEEKLLRATALSYLVTMYIKEYSGRLSAFCGCAIAAGTGMACAYVFLKDGEILDMHRTANNMASSITGMICDGGNQGCAMKGIVAVDAAFRSATLAMDGIYIYDQHGINSNSTEETFKYMGRIASPGMVETEGVIVKIFEEKLQRS